MHACKKIKYGDVPDYGDENRNWLSDFEHRDIIIHRVEGTIKDRHRTSMHKIAEDQHRSPQTVLRHIKDHNARATIGFFKTSEA